MITLIAPALEPNTTYFMKVFSIRGTWYIFQDGLIRNGKHVNVITRLHAPSYVGTGVEGTGDNVFFVFNDWKTYVAMCALDEQDIIDNYPCPDWATGCLI